MGETVETYPFRPLFSLAPEMGRRADVCFPKREKAEFLPSDSLADMRALRSAKRQGVKVVVPAVQQVPERVIALADGPVLQGLGSHTGSNETIDTLESSVEMLPPSEAANLAPTNAPVPKTLPRRPTSVKSV